MVSLRVDMCNKRASTIEISKEADSLSTSSELYTYQTCIILPLPRQTALEFNGIRCINYLRSNLLFPDSNERFGHCYAFTCWDITPKGLCDTKKLKTRKNVGPIQISADYSVMFSAVSVVVSIV